MIEDTAEFRDMDITYEFGHLSYKGQIKQQGEFYVPYLNGVRTGVYKSVVGAMSNLRKEVLKKKRSKGWVYIDGVGQKRFDIVSNGGILEAWT